MKPEEGKPTHCPNCKSPNIILRGVLGKDNFYRVATERTDGLCGDAWHSSTQPLPAPGETTRHKHCKSNFIDSRTRLPYPCDCGEASSPSVEPAPTWEIRSSVPYNDGFTIFSGYGENNRTICRGWHCDKKTQAEIASLISAAPDMFTSLKKLLPTMKNWLADVQADAPDGWQSLGDQIAFAEVAIKKAEGAK